MLWRLRIFLLRFADYLLHLPFSLLRLFKWTFFITRIRGKDKWVRWLAGIVLLIADLTPLPVLIETLLDCIKTKTRPLTEDEIALAVSVFGKKIPLHLVGVDPDSIPAKKRKTVAYVIFHTINFDQEISPATFIHELVHIWQYHHYGSVYISEALWAQRRGGGYNYGGIEALRKHDINPGLCAFNFEQQADIIEEHFRLTNKLHPQWCEASEETAGLLSRYAREIHA